MPVSATHHIGFLSVYYLELSFFFLVTVMPYDYTSNTWHLELFSSFSLQHFLSLNLVWQVFARSERYSICGRHVMARPCFKPLAVISPGRLTHVVFIPQFLCRSCLDYKFFHSLSITSNLWTYTWSIKCR